MNGGGMRHDIQLKFEEYIEHMSTRLTKKAKDSFERIKTTDESGIEWWSSRELAKVLTYTDYRNFLDVMRKAWTSCLNSGQDPKHHFVRVTEKILIGKGAEREVETWLMSRYVCYLTVQNADPKKTIVAQAQTYFAIQTRRAEKYLVRPFTEEEEKRLMLRREMKKHNSRLASAAKDAGVITNKDYGVFQNAGYKGLYGGLDRSDIHFRKGLAKNQEILDHMGSTELAANLFRATQTEDKLRREGVKGKDNANRTHFEVGKKVRETIMELGGTMPEELPTPESVKRLENRQKRLNDRNNSPDVD